MKQIAFLASPYSHSEADVREQRYCEAITATKWLLDNGWHVYSPIVSTHRVADESRMTYHSWALFNYHMIDACDYVVVLCINGWIQSIGVAEEIKYAHAGHKPVLYLVKRAGNSYTLGTTPY